MLIAEKRNIVIAKVDFILGQISKIFIYVMLFGILSSNHYARRL